MKNRIYSCALASLAAANGFCMQEAQRPNIIYIMCDDMGYGDLGCYGQRLISTPRIDSLASEGMRFTQAYAGSPVSAPSRASFMTGQHTGHTEVRGNKEYWHGKLDMHYGDNVDYSVVGQHPYDPGHVIIPEIFKDNGYATGMFGKWAGGYEGSVSTPDKRGIDEYFGYICQFQAHLYYPNFLNEYSRSRGDSCVRRVTLEQNIGHAMYGDDYLNRKQYSADIIHRKALEWLDNQSPERPFLGIFTYTLPHAELIQPRDSILEMYHERLKGFDEKLYGGDEGSRYNPTATAHAQFAGMITRLDKQVGDILDLLEKKGLAENTVVIFTSDNGPHEEGGGDPDFFNRDGLLRGIKRSIYEGGIRIPFIVRWPGHVKAGAVNDHILAFYDLMPTFCDIAGIRDYTERYGNRDMETDYFDGISFYPSLTGNGTQIPHEFLYWEFHETDMIGVRMGDWKLVVRQGDCELYNLASDVHEDHNVAGDYPDIVRKMRDIIARYDNICNHVHLPVQSGSDSVLKAMNRKYTREWYLGRVAAIRRRIPDCGLSSDLFTGFHDESEEDFQQTLSLMEEAAFDSSFMFKYSERPGTLAARTMPDNIPEDVKIERLNRMIALQNRLSAESNKRDIGKVFEVLVEGVSKRSTDQWVGRTQQNKTCVFPRGDYHTGDFVKVVVRDASSATLICDLAD